MIEIPAGVSITIIQKRLLAGDSGTGCLYPAPGYGRIASLVLCGKDGVTEGKRDVKASELMSRRP
jgi:hypothetical protein